MFVLFTKISFNRMKRFQFFLQLFYNVQLGVPSVFKLSRYQPIFRIR